MEENNEKKFSDIIEDFIKALDISIADLERIGALFLTFGYSNFFRGANLDIMDALDINNTGESPDEVTLFGQQLVLIGYTFLYIVSVKRIEEKAFINANTEEKINLSPYKRIADAYFISVFANSIRVQAFAEIANANNGGEFIE